ncbi:MAG: ABC transporter substrate-binding protein [Elusimicrobia bacterium]|nr:ABC transporter substrate-binding protein [Elusimicrobiota bacterium]
MRKLIFLAVLLWVPADVVARETLVVCDDVRDPLTLDPQKEFTEKNHTIVQQIYEGLVRFDPNGKIEPVLALSWQRKDPLRMRFNLRRDVLFHDGEPFDAESVKFSIERYLNPETGFPALGFINSLDKVEVLDPYTVDILTKLPDGLLLNRLAGFILMVPPGYIGRQGAAALNNHPVGTGAFRFDRWESGKFISLSANEAHWNFSKSTGKIKNLIFKFIPEDKQISSLLKGEVDLLTSVPGTKTVFLRKNPSTRLLKKPALYTIGACLRTTGGPLADRRVRKALNYALNKADLIRYDVLGNGIPLASLTFPQEEGHNPNLKPYAYDPKYARQLLAEAGYRDGLTLKTFLKVNAERTGNIIAAQLKRVGILLDITLVPDALLMEYLKKEKWDMIIGDVPNPMMHPFFIQAIFIYSKSPFALAQDAEYDRMLETLVQTMDPAKQKSLSRKIDRYVHEEALSLFTYQRIRTYGIRRGIHFEPYLSGMPYFLNVYWDKEEDRDNPKSQALHR